MIAAPLPIADWYAMPSGRRAARLLAKQLEPVLALASRHRLLGVGVCAPVLMRVHSRCANRALVSDISNARAWPHQQNCVIAADFCHLPLAEALFDDAMVLHAFEFAESPRLLLRELWRVLAPGGRLILIVPNRGGLWTQFEHTPFGHGHNYSASAIAKLLDEAMFAVETNRTALFAPPIAGTYWLEAALARITTQSGGVRIVTARKTDGLSPMLIGRSASLRVAPTG